MATITIILLIFGYGCTKEAKMGLTNRTEKNTAGGNMKILKIKWQRLISNEQTCPRCSSTEKEIEKAIPALKQSLCPLGIEVILEKEELSLAKFKKDPFQSNRIWINDQSLEELINAEVGQSSCCDVCGPSECRTVEVEGKVYETISANLVIRAGLLAGSKLLSTEANKSDCEPKSSKKRHSSCCPK